MEIKSKQELEAVAKECRKMTTKAAFFSAGGGAVPAPGVDIAADVAILLKTIPRISKKFGLSKEQIDELNDELRIVIFDVIKRLGYTVIGKALTKDVIITILKRTGVKIASRQIAKYVPIVGTLLSAGISFAAMKIVCNQHINDCYDVVVEVLKQSGDY